MKNSSINTTYTYKFSKLLLRDIKRLSLAFDIVTICITLIYPIFAIFMEFGNFWVNIAILCLTVIYATCLFIFKDKKKFKMERIYAWSTVVLGLTALVINVYSIYIATTNVNAIAIILATLMTIFWVCKVIVNILYDLISPRLNTLMLCLKEDSKPYAKIANQVTSLLKMGNVFNVDETEDLDTPKQLLKVLEKDKKIENNKQYHAILKDIKKDFINLKDKTETDLNGVIHIPDLISVLLSIDKIIVNKTKFIYQEYTGILKNKDIKKLLKYGPSKIGLKDIDLEVHVDKIVSKNYDDAKEFIKYIQLDKIDVKTDKEFKKMLIAFAPIIVTMQKIIYLYGFEQIDDPDEISQLHLQALMLALSIALKDEDADDALEELYNLSTSSTAAFLNFMDKGFKIFKKKKDEISTAGTNNAELIARIEDKYFKGKIGLILNENDETKESEK